jgi:hypothetical protein
MGIGGAAAGIALALVIDVLAGVLSWDSRSCVGWELRLAAASIVAGCAGLLVAGFRLKGSERGGTGLFLTAAAVSALLMTAPLTIALLGSRLCRP